MPFTPTTWVDGTTAITAAELNRIEAGVDDAHAGDIDDNAIERAKIADGAVGFNQLGATVFGTSTPVSGGVTVNFSHGRYWYYVAASTGDWAFQVYLNGAWRNVIASGDAGWLDAPRYFECDEATSVRIARISGVGSTIEFHIRRVSNA